MVKNLTLKRKEMLQILEYIYYNISITDTCFGQIDPHRCDVEHPIDRKIIRAMGDSV